MIISNFDNLPEMLTILEVGKILRLSRSKAYNLSKQDKFPIIKIGKCIRVSKYDLVQWLKLSSESVM